MENKEYANLLLEIYAGRNSELTKLNKYIYQLSVIDEKYTNTLYDIIKIKINNIRLLGKTIKKLGIDPIYIFPNNINDGYKYWNSSYVNFENNINKILMNNIKDEELSIEKYNDIDEKINDEKISSLLNKIKINCTNNINTFKTLYNNSINYGIK